MNLRILIFAVFGTGLLTCAPPSPLHDELQFNQVPLPIWQQTDYIFYNRTGDRITIILIETGKAVKKDGTVVEKSDGATRGDDGIVQEFIINESGKQEYITREYDETPLELEDGECVFTASYYRLDLKIRGKTICDSSRHGKPDPQRPCYDEVNRVRREKGWRDIDNREEGSFPYVEFYNITHTSHLFEGGEEPREFDNSFSHSCTMLVPDGYDLRSEIN